MSGFCKYKDLFGAPNTGVHRFRIFNIAIVDVAVTLVIVYLFSRFTKINIWISLVIFFIAMLVSHRLFCVRSTTDKLFFPDKNDK